MNKRQKALVLLFSVFAVGFLLGLLVGRAGRGRGEVRADVLAASGPASEIASGAASGSALSAAADAAADDDADDDVSELGDDVDGMGETVQTEIIYYGPRLPYAKLFADLNDAHLELARRTGLPSVPATREEVAGLRGLVKIVSCEAYEVDDLDYSMPFLTAAAARELEEIAVAFRDSLRSKGLLDYKIVVTSLLRTEEDVNRLRRSGNPNASDNSAHCYGTTFDIAYTRYYREVETNEFMQPYELTKVLGEVLRERHNAGKCLIKYERKEHCFHITARK